MNKRSLSESDICDRYITPALRKSGWNEQEWRREYSFTDGQVIVRGNLTTRGKRKRADYLLFAQPNRPIAVIEAKDNTHSLGDGMQQGIAYAEVLDVPFIFSSNGDGFLFHDRTGLYSPIEQTLSLDEFPLKEELWEKYLEWKGLTDIDPGAHELVISPNHSDARGKTPRYYQQNAINSVLDAIAKGQQRLLLAMATGTGKTFTAFNIIWRLWKSKQVKRVLFLADRNILVDQTMVNDFQPFKDVMTKMGPQSIDGNGNPDTSYEIYLSLYQAIVGGEDRESIYDKFPRDFFDLIVVDECHRGSAKDDSLWREILEYFETAIQLGLTATPKETKYVSNVDYFEEPVYTYSLKQGIADGFLAPYKVIRVNLDQDMNGWRPTKGQVDDNGNPIEDRIYNLSDIDRGIIFPQRDKEVAAKITDELHDLGSMKKTIVFCASVDHAERMRQALTNNPKNKELVQADSKYVMRITGDNEVGKAQLDNFIDPKRDYPVIVTTSKLLSTGVDAQTCHLIVLDQTINSLSEFKQIIGRGTRLRTDFDKWYFTILDFRGATRLFADPDWDGAPVQDDDFGTEGGGGGEGGDGGDPLDSDPPYVVSGVEFSIIGERVQYLNRNGELVMENLRDFTKRTCEEEFRSLGNFVKRWTEAERKQAIISELGDFGQVLRAMEEQSDQAMDPFDLICHIAFDQPPLTRQERANNVKKRDLFTKYGETANQVLEALLDKYADQGIEAITDIQILQLDPFDEIGTTIEIVNSFGGRVEYDIALRELETAIYAQAG